MALRLTTVNAAATTRSQKFGNENVVGSKMVAGGGGDKKFEAAAGNQLLRPARRAPLVCLSNKIEQTAGKIYFDPSHDIHGNFRRNVIKNF